jgi:hypothetical protein
VDVSDGKSPIAKLFGSRKLKGISDIRNVLQDERAEIFFIGPTAFNLLGIDRWVRNFGYIVYYDSGIPATLGYSHGQPSHTSNSGAARRSTTTCCVIVKCSEYVASRSSTAARPMVAMVFFDEETEKICRELEYNLILPQMSCGDGSIPRSSRRGSGRRLARPSVPNVLGRADSYQTLNELADDAGLGFDLVVQTPYGDSGKTTFFITSEVEWDRDSENIIGEELKIMKRINNHAVAVEAVNTRHGTVVGPFMTDLTGYPELTPYRGGWCGNDLFPEALSEAHRATAISHVRRLGDRLRQEGYKGFFEVDVLVDLDSEEVYLGELNPRISGASSMTNVTAGAYADIPLFLFHLLEFMGVDYNVDVDEMNERWRELAAVDVWAQLIMKEPNDSVERILSAPRTGTYRLDEDGNLSFVRVSNDWHEVTHEDECFYMRVYGPGDYRFKGADLGILVTKGRMQTSEGLTRRCRSYIEGHPLHVYERGDAGSAGGRAHRLRQMNDTDGFNAYAGVRSPSNAEDQLCPR